MDLLLILLGCAVLVAVGWPWSAILPGELLSISARLGLAYMAGAALTTLGLLLTTFAGLAVGRPAVVLVTASLGIGGAVLARRRDLSRFTISPNSSHVAIALLVLAVVALALGTANAIRFGAPTNIDFMNAWGLKGKAAFVDGNLSFTHLGQQWLYYPLNVSNLYAATFVVLGHADESVLRVPGALFGVSLAGIVWGLSRRLLPAAASAATVALVVVTPVYVTSMSIGLADLPLAAYLTLSIIAAYLWVLEGGAGWAALAGFASGAAAWTKVEGVPLVLVVLLVAAVLQRRRPLREIGVWIAWLAIFTVPWQVFMQVHGITRSARHFTIRHTDLGVITLNVARLLTSFSHWGVFWIVCLIAIAVTAPYWWRTRSRMLAALVLPNFVLTMTAWMTTVSSCVPCSIRGIGDRLYLHVAPSVALLAVVVVTDAAEALRVRAGPPAGRRRENAAPVES